MKTMCPNCRKDINVPDDAEGKQGRCPACKQVFRIPVTERTIVPPTSPVAPDGEQDKMQEQFRQSVIDWLSAIHKSLMLIQGRLGWLLLWIVISFAIGVLMLQSADRG